MLNKLLIKNIALIDFAEIDFKNGLNVLSGETGSGKSVILEAINFVLGAKADKTLIRTGENECQVSAVFDVSNNLSISSLYSELDFEDEEELIITRKFNIEGKSSIKINGNSATSSMLKKFTAILVDVHGQSEHFFLLKPSNQSLLIDKYCGETLAELQNDAKNIFFDYKNVLANLQELGGEESSRELRLDLLNYQINEIETANIIDGEEEILKEKKEIIKNKEKIYSALWTIKSGIEDEGGIDDVVSNCQRAISTISKFSDEYSELENRFTAVSMELSDIASSVSNILDNTEQEDLSIDYVEERLDLIKNIKRKYGENFISFLENAKIERDRLINFEALAENLLKEKTNFESVLYEKYILMRKIRQEKANEFCIKVINELKTLGMSGAKFYAKFNDIPLIENCSYNSCKGFDNIEFMFSANVGEPEKPLSNVISGGEMSRFMLAIKVVTANLSDISTFIFDEIDAGISGKTASVVAEKFAKISQGNQIIAISHLPQISAMADNNLLILKDTLNEKSYTKVKNLSGKDKINEIIRLIGGKENSDVAYAHAKSLVEEAEKYKLNIKN